MIHNHEVRSSILRPATKLEALAFFASAFFVFVPSRELCGVGLNVKPAQRKIPVDLHFIVRLRHKASGAALGLTRLKLLVSPIHVLKLILDSHWGMFDF